MVSVSLDECPTFKIFIPSSLVLLCIYGARLKCELVRCPASTLKGDIIPVFLFILMIDNVLKRHLNIFDTSQDKLSSTAATV